MAEPTTKPTPPGDGECCEGGCDPCVWDRYYEALHRWQQQQSEKRKTTQITGES
ncbi:oxidoreductase-like domain-containing protein [Motiliproteus sp. SC1-56]|uniref:oxidoreductase-like domain-containing protein n=1 Tax=Motiliproteus sp. SC1-56 TaxID=2799565 RepID=UPI001A8F9D17|nr:oxidoreductase-like domain-containing protein [Motiliproteus sp. SC1-56]